ncbi:hypothetical protein [Acrocarpospora sp. B8E8]|uniref:hypothetical protein n=1 Tax=Acrocarpospora sp. B8E8 TaxID=3153572 RepID=UPI00325D54EF
MSNGWSDEELIRRLAAAQQAAEVVPRDFMEAGKAAFAWYNIDVELAELTYDSGLHQDEPMGVSRVDTATLRALTYVSAQLTIELEVTEDALLGQIVPGQSGDVQVWSRSGQMSKIPIDDVGYFVIPRKPAEHFRLLFRTASGLEVSTTSIVL